MSCPVVQRREPGGGASLKSVYISLMSERVKLSSLSKSMEERDVVDEMPVELGAAKFFNRGPMANQCRTTIKHWVEST
jgi:hypothetical protein